MRRRRVRTSINHITTNLIQETTSKTCNLNNRPNKNRTDRPNSCNDDCRRCAHRRRHNEKSVVEYVEYLGPVPVVIKFAMLLQSFKHTVRQTKAAGHSKAQTRAYAFDTCV